MVKIIKNTTKFKELADKKYLFYLDTGLMKIYEPVTLKGLIRYIINKMKKNERLRHYDKASSFFAYKAFTFVKGGDLYVMENCKI